MLENSKVLGHEKRTQEVSTVELVFELENGILVDADKVITVKEMYEAFRDKSNDPKVEEITGENTAPLEDWQEIED